MNLWIFSKLYWRDDDRVVYGSDVFVLHLLLALFLRCCWWWWYNYCCCCCLWWWWSSSSSSFWNFMLLNRTHKHTVLLLSIDFLALVVLSHPLSLSLSLFSLVLSYFHSPSKLLISINSINSIDSLALLSPLTTSCSSCPFTLSLTFTLTITAVLSTRWK